MPESCLVKACYSILVKKCNAGVTNQASRERYILYQNGYGYIWEVQCLIEVDTFLYEFSLTILVSGIQMWNTEVSQPPKPITYRQFKCGFEEEDYLFRYTHVFNKKDYQTTIQKLKQVDKNILRDKRSCTICENKRINVIEDGIHFVVECKPYSE